MLALAQRTGCNADAATELADSGHESVAETRDCRDAARPGVVWHRSRRGISAKVIGLAMCTQPAWGWWYLVERF